MTELAGEIVAELLRLRVPKAPAIRAVRRRYSGRLRGAPGVAVKRLALELNQVRAPGTRVVACEVIRYHPSALLSVRSRDLERMGKGMKSWGDVDVFGCLLAGPAWRASQVPDSLIHSWTRSVNPLWRRAALVSTVPLNVKAQGGMGDPARTLAVCRRLASDREDLVVKALSWALRALVQPCPEAVERFLKVHASKLAPRVLLEVGNKLRTGLKNPKR